MISLVSLVSFLCAALPVNISLHELSGAPYDRLVSKDDFVVNNEFRALLASSLSDLAVCSGEVLAVGMDSKISWNGYLNTTFQQSVEFVKNMPVLLMPWCLSIMVASEAGPPQGQSITSKVNSDNACAGNDCQLSKLTKHSPLLQTSIQQQNVDYLLGIGNNTQVQRDRPNSSSTMIFHRETARRAIKGKATSGEMVSKMRGGGGSVDADVKQPSSPRFSIERFLVSAGFWVFFTVPDVKPAVWSSREGSKKGQEPLSFMIQGMRSNKNNRINKEGRKRCTILRDQGARQKSRPTTCSDHNGRMNRTSRKKRIGNVEGTRVISPPFILRQHVIRYVKISSCTRHRNVQHRLRRGPC